MTKCPTLLFTLSLFPLSRELQKTGYGYQLDEQTKISHLFYVDNLKLYGTYDNQLNGLVNKVTVVSDDIRMEFSLDRCAKAILKREKKMLTKRTKLNRNNFMHELESETVYTCLGIEAGEGTEHHTMKAKIQQEYKRRIKLVLKSELNT